MKIFMKHSEKSTMGKITDKTILKREGGYENIKFENQLFLG